MLDNPLPTLKITAEVAASKFFLREMLFFFLKRRSMVLFDADFSFTANDFSDFISEAQFSGTMGGYISNHYIEENLRILSNDFLKRDKYLRLKEPKDALLKFGKEGAGDNKVFTVKNCPTDYINSALRYLDISLMLISEIDDRKRMKDMELQRRVESVNSESLFGQDKDHKLIFCNKITGNSLELKERSIFDTLKRKFKQDVGYKEILSNIKEVSKFNRNIDLKDKSEKGYVNDGVGELRKKLYKISGNPETIIMGEAKKSIYKLIY